MGPEVMAKFLDPGEYVKRLAAAQGIDVLNLVKTPETMAQEKQEQMQQAQQQALIQQAGQLAGAPMMDPSKNPAMGRSLNDGYDQLNGQSQGESPNTGEEEAPPEG
jgi:23S rRNA pseudoU1915 N3-methylase RlmH